MLLKDIERNLEECKKAIEIKDNLLTIKRYLKNAKSSYDSIVRENKQLEEYIVSITQGFNQYQRQQEEQNLLREKEYFQRLQKNIKN